MNRLLILFAVLLCASGVMHAQNAAECGFNVPVSSATITAAGSTQIMAAPTRGSIRVCAWTIQVQQGATAANFGLIAGTGAACATNPTLVTPAFLGTASTTQSAGQVYTPPVVMALPAQSALCLNLSSAPTGAVVHVLYAIY